MGPPRFIYDARGTCYVLESVWKETIAEVSRLEAELKSKDEEIWEISRMCDAEGRGFTCQGCGKVYNVVFHFCPNCGRNHNHLEPGQSTETPAPSCGDCINELKCQNKTYSGCPAHYSFIPKEGKK